VSDHQANHGRLPPASDANGPDVARITLPRAVVEQVREALVVAWQSTPVWQIAEARNALDAALAEPKKERAEVAAPARDDAELGYVCIRADEAYREHVTDGSPCWCNPELNYRDPDTGTELWIHRREQ
jgi:hypothetical protein